MPTDGRPKRWASSFSEETKRRRTMDAQNAGPKDLGKLPESQRDLGWR